MHDPVTAPALSKGLNLRLSLMMFLQYAIWGAWLPILYPYLLNHLKFTDGETGNVFAVGAIGAIVGPFLAGQIADRYLATEKLLGLCHLVGAGLMYILVGASDYSTWLWVSLAYGVVYGPTLALTNSLALAHVPSRDRDFGRVRVWGTVGWIAVGIGVGQWLLARHTPLGTETQIKLSQEAGRVDAFYLAMFLGGLLGLYSWTLPHTPPSPGEKNNATAKAFGETLKQPLLVLFLISIAVSVIHQMYFVFTADFLSAYGRDAASSINKIFGVGGGGLMTIGQMSEVMVLAFVIPFLAQRLSRKSLLAMGLAAYAGRMALFAFTDSMPSVLLGVALHGLCFGSFVFVAFMVVDEETSRDVRASAQNLYNLVFIGVGVGLGSLVAGRLGSWAKVDGDLDHRKLFAAIFYAALACLAAHLLFYRGGRRTTSE